LNLLKNMLFYLNKNITWSDMKDVWLNILSLTIISLLLKIYIEFQKYNKLNLKKLESD
jgi:hypothetical protein